MLSRGNLLRDFGQGKAHRLGVARWQDKRRAFAVLQTNSAEDIGPGGSLVAGSRAAHAALCPPSRNLVLLADARLIGKPDLYIRWVDAFVVGDLRQRGREGFFKILNRPLPLRMMARASGKLAIAHTTQFPA